MAERTYTRERLEQPLRITAAADMRRLSRRWAGASQYEMQLHYHRIAVRWLRRRALRQGLQPIPGSDYTTVEEPPYIAGRPMHLRSELLGRVRLDAWRADDGALAHPGLEEAGVPSSWDKLTTREEGGELLEARATPAEPTLEDAPR